MHRIIALLALFTVAALARAELPVAPLTFAPVAAESYPAVATDGVRSLVVWEDSRDPASRAIYGARLDADGTLLDPAGVRLLDGDYRQPAIAYGNGRYLVVNSMLRYAIVDRDANVVARGALPEEAAGSARVRAVFNGIDFVVLWSSGRIGVSIVDRDGNATTPATLLPQEQDVYLHSAATNGSRIVALYTRRQELRALVTSSTGVPVSDSSIAPLAYPSVPATIAAQPDAFVAVWLRDLETAAVRFDANGALVQGPAVIGAAGDVVAAGDAFRLFTVEEDSHGSRLVRRTLTRDLVAEAPQTLFESPSLRLLRVTAAEAFAVVRIHDPERLDLQDGLYAIDADTPGEPRMVSRAGVAQLEPRIATGDAGTFVAWRETFALRGAFLPRMGEREDFPIGSGSIRSHAVAVQGDSRLAVWSTDGDVVAMLDGKTIALDAVSMATNVAAVSDGHGFVIAWAKAGQVHVARMTDGELTDRFAVPYVTSLGRTPTLALACDGGECLLVWRSQDPGSACMRAGCMGVDERVLAMRFDSGLATIDAMPRNLSGKMNWAGDVAAAAHQGAYAVSWTRGTDTYVRTLASPETLVVPGLRPALAREDRGWLLVRENGGELVAMRIRDAGTPYEFTLLRDAQARTAPAVARDGASTVAVYERTTRGEAAGGVPRIFLTAIGPTKGKARAISR